MTVNHAPCCVLNRDAVQNLGAVTLQQLNNYKSKLYYAATSQKNGSNITNNWSHTYEIQLAPNYELVFLIANFTASSQISSGSMIYRTGASYYSDTHYSVMGQVSDGSNVYPVTYGEGGGLVFAKTVQNIPAGTYTLIATTFAIRTNP